MSIDSTTSVHRSLLFSFSLLWRSLAAVSLSSLEFASFVDEKQVFTLFIPTRDVSFAAPSRDMLTGGVQQHFTVVIICFIEVGGSRQWQSCSNCFHFILEVGPVRFAKVPSPDRSSPDSLD